MTSPFDGNTVANEATETPWSVSTDVKEAPKVENKTVVENTVVGDAKLSVTLKGGKGYQAPWIVLYGNSVEEMLGQVSNPALRELIDRTAEVGQYFAGKEPLAPARSNNSGGGYNNGGGNRGGYGNRGNYGNRGGNNGAPQQEYPVEYDQFGQPICPPGWEQRSGFKNGKPWSAYFPPKGQNYIPIWLNN